MLINAALLASLNVTRKQFDARVAQIVTLLSCNDKAVLAACVRLYGHQTWAEKLADRTTDDNGVGFQEMDAKFGSRMARVLMSGREVFPHNMPRLRRMARKYRRQLAVMSFRKERAAKAAVAEAEAFVKAAGEPCPATMRSACAA